jgi:threonyl-tRNA synthetase
MKPMNCPHHTQIYNHLARSYRDLPQRYAETTMCYRDEQSGELHGLSRVRGFAQDDAHVFCRESQVKEEMFKIWDIIEAFYKAVGFGDLRVRLSLHDPKNFEKYLGTKDVWERTEKQLREMVQERGVEAFEALGEAAMYGPKIDFMAKDSIGREWQVATIQIDRNQPERFDLVCTNEQGEKERIVMVHAAIMGSIERFLSILIEHHAGAFPVWVSPVQVQLAPVSSKHVDGARDLVKELSAAGIRVGIDEADETIGNKVRKAAGQKIPYIVVVGDKELGGEPWMIRVRGQKDQISMSKTAFIEKVVGEILKKNA